MLRRIVQQPVLHFLAIGAALFAVYYSINDEQPVARPNDIVVSPQVAKRLVAQFQASWRRNPSTEELTGLIGTYVDEEVLVREAKTLSLDQGDTVIRQRLQQKMRFIAKSAAAAIEPKDDELRAYFSQNQNRYARGGTFTFEQVFLGKSLNPDTTERTLGDLNSGHDPASLGTASLIPNRFASMGARQIDGNLGPGVFDALRDLEPEVWSGPIPTGYGYHLMRVTAFTPATVPEFQMIRKRILADWRANFEKTLAEQQLATMRARYSVDTPDVKEIEAILK